MLYDTQEQTAGRSWTCVYSCAGEGTMVSMRALLALLGLIT